MQTEPKAKLQTPLFRSRQLLARELAASEIPALQALFERNPGYFLTVGGQPPSAAEAQTEFDELPPAHLSFAQRWFAGLFDTGHAGRPAGALQGLAIVLSDLCAPGVWHIALFFLADELHGSGAAKEIFEALQAWAEASGAQWLRLGVVSGNGRAERFWARLGFMPLRTRELLNASGAKKLTWVMLKPLAGGSKEEYLVLVPRDQPDSELP